MSERLHGTYRKYLAEKCRCDYCTAASRVRQRLDSTFDPALKKRWHDVLARIENAATYSDPLPEEAQKSWKAPAARAKRTWEKHTTLDGALGQAVEQMEKTNGDGRNDARIAVYERLRGAL